MSLNLGEVFRLGLEITLRRRILWLYGFLLVILSGECARVHDSSFNLSQERADQMMERLRDLDPATVLPAIVGVLVVVLIGWLLLSLFVGAWARAALIEGVRQEADGGRATFGTTAAAGGRHLWRMVLLDLITGLAVLVAVTPAVTTILVAVVTESPVWLLTLCLWGPLLLFAVLIFGLVVTVAQVQVVLDDAGPLEALGSGWRFLRRHPWDVLLVWLVNEAGIGCAAGCVLSTVVSIGFVPAIIGFLINPVLGLTLAVPATLLALVAAVGSGIIHTFKKAVWVLTCERLNAMEPPAGPVDA